MEHSNRQKPTSQQSQQNQQIQFVNYKPEKSRTLKSANTNRNIWSGNINKSIRHETIDHISIHPTTKQQTHKNKKTKLFQCMASKHRIINNSIKTQWLHKNEIQKKERHHRQMQNLTVKVLFSEKTWIIWEKRIICKTTHE